MKSVECSADGMDSLQSKTPRNYSRRNEAVAGDKDELIVSIPLVVEVAIVVVQPLLAIVITIHIEQSRVVVGVIYEKYHLYHHPSGTPPKADKS